MPHMSPMAWILIMILSLNIFFSTSMMFYFSSLPNLMKKNNSINNKWMWKWI
uniref:ATP synthase F0 subunit 8 n=1 Tax=Acropyga smithii TaxID=602228 RepID=A0A6G5NIM1_9HYME|nr:ATP synthase F0 subunit 8 [Acropyga smithii]QBG38711.1 ATP synthase F0 subunit 8 [Acropyga smithii]